MSVANFDICIVGSGMAGASLACALQTLPLRIALIESQQLAKQNLPLPINSVKDVSYRASAITPASASFLKGLSVWNEVVSSVSCPFDKMSVWDGLGTGSIDFSANAVDASELGFIVENRRLLDAMLQNLRAQRAVSIIDGVSVDRIELPQNDSSLAELTLSDGQHLQTHLIVAADGANSPLRSMAGFTTREWDYNHSAIVATVETELAHDNTARQIFLAEGPLAFLPVRDNENHQCLSSIVWSCDPKTAEKLMALDEASFCRRLTDCFERKLGKVVVVGERASFPLRQRHSLDYVKPGIALVADAAHTIHPLAGQGINLGFSDVAVLAEEISRAQNRGRDFFHFSVLQRYQRRRKGDNLRMIATVEAFKRLYGEAPLAVQLIRNIGMRWVDRITPLKNKIIQEAMGLP